MATLYSKSTFVSWDLDPQEQNAAAILTSLQKQLIQNMICKLAEEKIYMDYDDNNRMAFVQAEAALKGKMQALQHLLDESQRVEVEQNTASIDL